ncbi:hypothetical protein BH10BDE1_BH10BDE1_17630 [soil metagenome]
MTFAEFLSQAWTDHGDQADAVASRIEQGLALCNTPDEIIALVNLTTHLYSEHIQKFVEGERKLREIGKNPLAIGTPAEFAVTRAAMAFRLCEGTIDPAKDRLGLTPGDLVRSLAVAASALATRDSVRAESYLNSALETVSSLELTSGDGIARGLAIAGNNSATSLEALAERSEQQTTFMLRAAQTARKYWEIAGTWLEVERAEYRFARSCLKADLITQAREHAKACLAICEQNNAAPLELFFAYECLATVESTALAATPGAGATAASPSAALDAAKTKSREWFEKMDPEDKSWARKSLEALG